MEAHLLQFPFWNEALRKVHFQPCYLRFGPAEDPDYYACVLTVGLLGLRIGLLQRGPVALRPDCPLRTAVVPGLLAWARHTGHFCLRLTHHDRVLLDAITASSAGVREDPFPFYRDAAEELLVEQLDDDQRMLLSFQQIARQEIKAAGRIGYEIKFSDTAEALAKYWTLFQSLADRKGFQYRPFSSYQELIRLGREFGCVRLYVALSGGQPVEAILVVRDRTTAHYMSGALDMTALQGRPSPSCALHWKAMRDFYHLGVRYYNLGSRSGPVYQFKRKFHPIERVNPPPATLVVNQGLYRLWTLVVLRCLLPLRGYVKRALSRS